METLVEKRGASHYNGGTKLTYIGLIEIKDGNELSMLEGESN